MFISCRFNLDLLRFEIKIWIYCALKYTKKWTSFLTYTCYNVSCLRLKVHFKSLNTSETISRSHIEVHHIYKHSSLYFV